ncbi:MAG: chemotaxis response regulator protein-glutamate methylesterase [Leptospiraceae bacterium]|nr:MAG: chemotaxis response regulator protein-glutamate methylesterase [Leptospiraceae bacterium]
MKILIVDDSPVARAVLTDFLKNFDFIQEIETARNGKVALELLESRSYDLILLDVEMPVMNGLTFLEEKKKRFNNIPTIMLSSYTQEGAEITLKALELGAMDFIPKPSGNQLSLEEIKSVLQEKIKNFYSELILQKTKKQTIESNFKINEATINKSIIHKPLLDFEIILIGSSTGGPRVLSNIIHQLPEDFPLPIAIVQHMPEYFTNTLAKRLSQISKLEVFEAENNKILEPGKIGIAKGDKHLLFDRIEKNRFKILISNEEKISGHRPSIDKTLFNLIQITNGKVIAIILTGMGRDGVNAAKELKKRGGIVIAQDESTSVIFGMNKRAIEEKAADIVLPDYKITEYLLKMNEF